MEKKPTNEAIKAQKSVIDRLNRVEGQIRGIKNMVEKGTYCDDVINQLEASRSALRAIELILMDSHFKNCIKEQIQSGNDEAVDELLKMVKKVMK